MSTIDAAGNIHAGDGRFAGHVRTEADPGQVLAPAGVAHAMCDITLQHWDDRDPDYARDIRTIEVDLAGVLARLTPEEHAELLDTLDPEYGYQSWHAAELVEELLDVKGRTDLLEGHTGPWTASFDADDIRAWLRANPAWVEDGTTPHPTGGYVRVEDRQVADGHSQIRFLDADGRLLPAYGGLAQELATGWLAVVASGEGATEESVGA